MNLPRVAARRPLLDRFGAGAILMSSLLPALLLGGCAGPAVRDAGGPLLRVLSFNIRYGTARDGDNHWDRRKDLCAGRAVAFRPDLLGLQEAMDFQNAHFQTALEGYGMIGVAREDGKAKGEFTTILYRRDRLELLSSGTFWLSETPEAAGSRSWDSALPRIASWGRFRDRAAGGRELLFVNTHFDHRGERARLESARLLRAFVEREARGAAAIVTGDFNAAPGSDPYRTLVSPALADTWRARHGESAEAGTAHPFTGVPSTPRIDWILCSPQFRVVEASIDRHAENGRYPSDHFPVSAVLAWR